MNTISKSAGASQDSPQRSHRYHDDVLRHKMHINVVLFMITGLCAFAYIGWASVRVDYDYWYIALPYIVAELLCLGSMIIWGFMLLHRREHPPAGQPLPENPPGVDVVVTCCGEPLTIIEKTLRAVARIDYPNYRVTVADDRNNHGVHSLCEELGFTHLCRPTHEHSKAGNLNYAVERTEQPFILTLDSDQIPHPTILKVLMGYFSVPHIGFVVTYQAFDVPPGDPWGNRDRVFYGAMQTARNDTNSAISCGSGVVYRRQALDEIGGFSTWNLVEDLHSSMLLHNAGWKSVYHPFPLTHGTAPAEVTSHVRQRWQWAVDSMRILFWRNPMFCRGLNFRQRLNYLSFGYNYLVFGIAYPVFFMIPIWGLLTGNFLLKASIVEFIAWRLPYLIAFMLLNRFLTDHRHTSKSFRAQVGLFAVFISAIITAIFSCNHVPRYSVTHKTVDHPSVTRRLFHVSVHLVVITLCVFGIIFGYRELGVSSQLYWMNAIWAAWVIWLLLPFTRVALMKPPEAIHH